MRFFLCTLCIIIISHTGVKGSESLPAVESDKFENYENAKHIKKRKIRKRLFVLKKKIKKRIQKTRQKIYNFFQKFNDPHLWLWVIGGVIAITSGLIFLGASAWLIIGTILGMFLYFAFLSFLFVRMLNNKFRLEAYWWLILLCTVAAGIFGAVYFLGINPVSSLIIVYLLYFGLGLVSVFIVFWLFVAIIKALFRPFFR